MNYVKHKGHVGLNEDFLITHVTPMTTAIAVVRMSDCCCDYDDDIFTVF